jgi:TolB protein
MKFPYRMICHPPQPVLSRRGILVAGAAGLLIPDLAPGLARAQSGLGREAAPAVTDSGPAINVTGAQNAPIPIAIPVFTDPSGAPSDIGAQITQVINDDLGDCGLFRAIDPSSFVPNSMGKNTPVWANWTILGAQALITGDVADQGGGQLRVEFRLWSITQQKQVQGTAYTATKTNWRRIAHIIGDVVYRQLIGEPGYFDSRVAYISETGSSGNLVRRLAVMDYDGQNNLFLTNGSSGALTPQFNPTRQQLAFVTYQSGNARVYLFDLQSGTQRLIGASGELTVGPQFSPDGNSLLMSVSRNGGAAIVKMSASGGGITELTDYSSINVSPSFSPDGSQIVFNSDRDGNQQLFVMGADGSGAKRISFGGGQYAEPAWSPRGDLIAYTRWALVGPFSVGVMAPDGSGERMLSQGFVVESPTFCPNGRVIMFDRSTGGHTSRLVTGGIDGFNERLVDTSTNASAPSWSPLLS